MKTMIYQERRKSPRIAYSALAVLKTPEGPSVGTAQIMDLSMEGACVSVALPLFAEQEFLLVIDSDEGEIVVRGVVRYTQAEGVAGLNFTRLSEKASGRLERLIRGLSETTLPGTGSPPAP